MWTNPSQDSSFEAQTITVLDDSEFEYILLVYDAIVPYQNYCTYLFKKPSAAYQLPFNQLMYSGSNVVMRLRYIKRNSNTQYSFTNGEGSNGQDSSLCVPIQIIGIKSI